MPRKSHVHKYILRPTDNHSVWTCALPGCNHFMPYHLRRLVEGRLSQCWGCETHFVLDELAMADEKPQCPVCRGLIQPNTNDESTVETILKQARQRREKNEIGPKKVMSPEEFLGKDFGLIPPRKD